MVNEFSEISAESALGEMIQMSATEITEAYRNIGIKITATE